MAPRNFVKIVLPITLLVGIGWMLLIRSFGYTEVTVEYKGQPITFGQHYVCYNRISYDIAFIVPHNFRITVGRSANLATTILPDGKQLVARLPESCGSEQNTSTKDNTSGLPSLVLADKPDVPGMLTFFVSVPALERGIDSLKFIQMDTYFSSYPIGFNQRDKALAPWYTELGSFNAQRELYYQGNICRLMLLKDIPDQNRGKPFFVKTRASLQGLTEPSILDSKVATEASFDINQLQPQLDLLKYAFATPMQSRKELQHFNPDQLAISSLIMPIELRDGVRFVRPDLAGTIRLYAQAAKSNTESTYTIDMFGKKTTTQYTTTGFYLPETESLLTCEDTGL